LAPFSPANGSSHIACSAYQNTAHLKFTYLKLLSIKFINKNSIITNNDRPLKVWESDKAVTLHDC